MNLVYIVVCYEVHNGDEPCHIDSIWRSKRKADKRCHEINYDEKEWREDREYGLFCVEQHWISK